MCNGLFGRVLASKQEQSRCLYVEGLIGRDTLTAVPAATLDAFRSHGYVTGHTAAKEGDEARAGLSKLAELGVDPTAIGEDLRREGVAAFASNYDRVLAGLQLIFTGTGKF